MNDSTDIKTVDDAVERAKIYAQIYKNIAKANLNNLVLEWIDFNSGDDVGEDPGYFNEEIISKKTENVQLYNKNAKLYNSLGLPEKVEKSKKYADKAQSYVTKLVL